jgi:hypothetical protein
VDNKKKKILIASGIGSFILVTLFAFLIFNHDKSNVSPTTVENGTNGSQQKADQNNKKTAKNDKQEESNEEVKEEPEVSTVPFTEVVYNGERVKVESGDLYVGKNGDLLVSSNFLSEKLGTPVSWEKEVVYIGQQPIEGTEEVGNYLSDMVVLRTYTNDETEELGRDSSISKDQWEEGTLFHIAGTQYNKGIGIYIQYPQHGLGYALVPFLIDYNLEGKYKTFKAEVGVDDQYKDHSAKFVVKVYGDGKLLHETKAIRGGDFAVPVEVDVTSVLRLTLEVEKVEESGKKRNEYIKFVIGNPVLQ